ncbi:hypothetical protein CYLTODRAFT_458030 [Cylindrobasidium torrendii FP15055 ss-10]|uniref:RRM domain-containing protein n=1 Tax=Cylindrobasidium torrendii FP15055 ss-10 TaxID=1314674 RepID=A0A0D7AYS7_9AGAR|nr:hypothetical protein CYLTODRAFT_458030 [Cylindrobasidium torrendii FP15055 ss-10]
MFSACPRAATRFSTLGLTARRFLSATADSVQIPASANEAAPTPTPASNTPGTLPATKRVLIKGIPTSFPQSTLRRVLEKYGTVLSYNLIPTKLGLNAFVDMSSREEAAALIKAERLYSKGDGLQATHYLKALPYTNPATPSTRDETVPPSTTVFLQNLPSIIPDDEDGQKLYKALFDLCNQWGEVRRIRWKYDTTLQQREPRAWVDFASKQSAAQMVRAAWSDTETPEFYGRRMTVNFSRGKNQARPT